jgi:hypothetical protein
MRLSCTSTTGQLRHQQTGQATMHVPTSTIKTRKRSPFRSAASVGGPGATGVFCGGVNSISGGAAIAGIAFDERSTTMKKRSTVPTPRVL